MRESACYALGSLGDNAHIILSEDIANTFQVLTEEDVMEPAKKLKDALKWKGLPEEGLFDVCNIGESRDF